MLSRDIRKTETKGRRKGGGGILQEVNRSEFHSIYSILQMPGASFGVG